MQEFTGWQYLMIDCANQYGLDKELFETRIQWAMDNLSDLEALGQAKKASGKKWKESPLYFKAVMAIRKAQKGIPTGHLVGLDAICSGPQLMSVLTGCEAGARHTGLIDPNMRADAYTSCTAYMNDILKDEGVQVQVSREDTKGALMPVYYGSKEAPKRLFGDATPELNAFYKAAYKVAPGAYQLLQILLDSWRPGALVHEWKLPDGYDARVKVMDTVELRIEVDELDHSTFTHIYEDNIGKKKGLSNAANVIHSFDAYVLRSMHRRCNYDYENVVLANAIIGGEVVARNAGFTKSTSFYSLKVEYYKEQYERSTVADVAILPHLTVSNAQMLSTEHLEALLRITDGMLQYRPFELVTIHDEFKAHPNNLNWVRWQYKEILAEIAESKLLDDLLSQVYQMPGYFPKLSSDLASKIRQSNYGLS